MASRPAAITKTELAVYALVMQEAGIPVWYVEAVKPDGTRLRISAGADRPTPRGGSIDKKLGITNG